MILQRRLVRYIEFNLVIPEYAYSLTKLKPIYYKNIVKISQENTKYPLSADSIDFLEIYNFGYYLES